MIVGPTGAGKSVLLAMLALQFRRYEHSQVFIFDKGRSARAAALMMAGSALDLSIGSGLAFQPLSDIDNAATRAFARDWVLSHSLPMRALQLILRSRIRCGRHSPVWLRLRRVERTLTGLSSAVAIQPTTTSLATLHAGRALGELLDGKDDKLSFADVMHFELEGLMETKGLVLPVLTYLFHKLEARFDGRPTLLILDEAWLFLDSPVVCHAHPRMAEDFAQEECCRGLCHAVPR